MVFIRAARVMIYDRPKWRTIQGNTVEYRMGVSFRRREHNFGKVRETGSARKSRGVRASKNKRKKKSYKRHGERG